jgi:hypothetical protein
MNVYIVFNKQTNNIMAVYSSYDAAAKKWLIIKDADGYQPYQILRYIVE